MNTTAVIFSFWAFTASLVMGQKVDPSAVLTDMATRYATCRSYQDSGVVLSSETPLADSMPFKTYFIRPDRFRFEWTETVELLGTPSDGPLTMTIRRVTGTNRIWCNPGGVYKYDSSGHSMDYRKLKRVEDLNLAVAGATGVSLCAAHTVSSMLTTRIHGFRLTELHSLIVLPAQVVEGVTCYRIRGIHPSSRDTCELWIGKNDHLLRKIRTSGPSPEDWIEEIHRNIRINGDISKEVFQFTPPK